MKTLQQVKAEQMENPAFAKEYEAIQPEMVVIRAIVERQELLKTSPKRSLQSAQKSIKQI